MSKIKTVLFDADGVIQSVPKDWFEKWGTLIDDRSRSDEFLQAVFKVEQPYLEMAAGFEQALGKLLKDWRSEHSLNDALAICTMIEPDKKVLNLIAALAQSGLKTGLATNQQAFRYRYMLEELDYQFFFEHRYASCEMGVKKPSKAYFEYILDDLGCAASDVLFIDDNQPNVDSARLVGLNAEQYHLDAGYEAMLQLLHKYDLATTL